MLLTIVLALALRCATTQESPPAPFEEGRQRTGRRRARRWSESGERLPPAPRSPIDDLFASNAEAMETDRARFLARFDGLHTRPKL